MVWWEEQTCEPLGAGFISQFPRGVAVSLWARSFTYLSLFRSVKWASRILTLMVCLSSPLPPSFLPCFQWIFIELSTVKKVLPVQGTGGKVPQGAYSLEETDMYQTNTLTQF